MFANLAIVVFGTLRGKNFEFPMFLAGMPDGNSIDPDPNTRNVLDVQKF